MISRRLLLALFLLPSATAICAAANSAETDWQTVLALEAGPQQPSEIRTREQARAVTLAHLAKQETTLRDFLRDHPQSAHTVDAQLGLARLLATRSDLAENPAAFEAALRLLGDALATAPEERRADLLFARLALVMRRMAGPAVRDREALVAQMNAFQTSYPNDRRVAALLTEGATLFDDQPRRKQELLDQALAAAPSPELRARIADDMKRLALLGHPIGLRGATIHGTEVDLARLQGKVVVVYFFASWSAPSLAGLEEMQYLSQTFSKESVEIVGVSLDPTPEVLQATVKARNITWPVIFDGKGWKSPLVRGLAINALPTLWLVDQQGNLRTMNVRTESEPLVRALLKEKKNLGATR